MAKNLLVLVLSLFIALSKSTPSFKVDVIYKPDVCDSESNYGDQMFVHFIGRKMDTGEIFDQRLAFIS